MVRELRRVPPGFTINFKDGETLKKENTPTGDAFQLWENTTEGTPVSPTFDSLEALCEWCANNATTFADYKATKQQWLEMLSKGLVFHKEGNIIFC
jgi:hypothetical protein